METTNNVLGGEKPTVANCVQILKLLVPQILYIGESIHSLASILKENKESINVFNTVERFNTDQKDL